MSRFAANRNDFMRPKHLNPDNISFSVFTTEEIKKLCVTRIITPIMLDALGHPLPGGLYDNTLGPVSEKGELCGTCNKNIYSCSGHFGYIELPLPVVNPIFHKIIGIILRMSCLSCYKIQIPNHIKHSLVIQIKLLDRGLVTKALDIQSKIMHLISQYGSFEAVPENSIVPLDEYESLTDKDEVTNQKTKLNKNVESLRNQFINDVLSEVKPLKVCMYCKKPMVKVQALKNKIILVEKLSDKLTTASKSSVMTERIKVNQSKYLSPEESRKCMRNIWREEKDLMQQMVSVLNTVNTEYPTDVFYFEVIPVPPPNVRPVNFVNGRILENPQSQCYKSIIQNSILLRAIIQVVQNNGDQNALPSVEAKAAYSYARGNTPIEKLNNCWEELQNDINTLVDSESMRNRSATGLKQIIEKKAGIIRMHMMGKRVNFSARSVITPDPNLNIDEIGIPEKFAKHLTYPVPVTTWNVEEVRKMILNGPDIHPGANLIEFEDGTVVRISSNPTKQQALFKRLLTPDDKLTNGFRGIKTVHRHLINGDILLLNRQPTLHKPSIMAHTARILKGEKTLRLHYANCKAYNADFDGDEMNAHFPQNELARSEGYNIANVANQYLVPKDGTPLSGLIQDHMVSGARMSIRGRFFNKDDYQQLVFQALSFKTSKIALLPPAIIKPTQLWSGKQIISTVIINIIPKGHELINLTATAKIPAKAWVTQRPRRWKAGGSPLKNDNDMSEAEVIIRNGELLVGILDKTHYGATPYGLIHCMYELYGCTYAIRLLGAFAKLFMRFLQQEGFTLGVHDILTVEDADRKRRAIIEESRKIGLETMTTVLDLPADTPIDEIVAKLEKERIKNPKFRALVDRQYKSALDSFTNGINKACLPAGLVSRFPDNNLQLMVQSGAKGSTVNTMQISCLLGQIELEGKRPPVMISGKSLPSFPIFEFAPRAGGFIDGRFMTGIQPQEFFFHCMAGREGLIDTAVKTSRSGYLQRCLVKHLEGLAVAYDMTVRDSDGSVIQFMYGEDGMDISKVQFLNGKQMHFLSENRKVFVNKTILHKLKEDERQSELKEHAEKIENWRLEYGDPLQVTRKSPFSLFSAIVKEKVGNKKISAKKIMEIWNDAEEDIKESFRAKCQPCPDPLNAVFQADHHFGSLNERLEALLNNFTSNKGKKYKKELQNVLKMKAMTSYCAAGEPVGLLAAQSIGEPSTQMTLNTFHFAGRGEMNVTLGIPRLREILMMASKNLKTPSMEIPFLDVPDLDKLSENLRKTLTKVVVANVLETIDVSVTLETKPTRQYSYTVRFNFLPHKYYKSDYCITPKFILKHMRKRFFGEMFTAIKKYLKINSNLVSMEEVKSSRSSGRTGGDDDDDEDAPHQANLSRDMDEESSSSDEVEDTEDAKMTNKFKQAHEDQEPESDEEEKSDAENETEMNVERNDDEIARPSEEAREVLDSYSKAKNYIDDQKKYLWCELTFVMPLDYQKLDLTAILRSVAERSVVWETPNIRKAITYMKNNKLTLRTDGININEMSKYNKLLDLNKLYCNDIHRMAETYGIEAAMKIIVREVQDVFNVYGIKVDPRHLSLIADYMTYNGTFEPLSRKGMESSASPFQQMSFEASLGFLKAATIRGKQDDLQNPSSCLIVGKPCTTGTGCFSLLQKIPNFLGVH